MKIQCPVGRITVERELSLVLVIFAEGAEGLKRARDHRELAEPRGSLRAPINFLFARAPPVAINARVAPPRRTQPSPRRAPSALAAEPRDMSIILSRRFHLLARAPH